MTRKPTHRDVNNDYCPSGICILLHLLSEKQQIYKNFNLNKNKNIKNDTRLKTFI